MTCLIGAFTPLLAADARVDGPAAMIVFDGSGSMWGRLEGDKKAAKLDLAREAVRLALPKTGLGSTRTGLMSFGHRRSGDCSDIETLVPLAVGDSARILQPLEKLNPRGKGPIASALAEAAKALGNTPQSAIVLIHDNADNCRQDPCETASAIAVANPKLKIHLVALGVDADELERVACIAKTTGGQLFDVREPNGVAPAVAEAFKLALLDGETSGPLTPPSEAEAKTVPAGPRPPAPPGLTLAARLATQSAVLSVPVSWRVTKGQTQTLVFEGVAPTITTQLPAGNYTVEGSLGFATARKTVEVSDVGATLAELAFDAAALRLTVRDLKDGPALGSALITVRSDAASTPKSERPLWIGRASDADFVLPAGVYRVHVTEGLIERDEIVTLAPGTIMTRDVVLNAGHLELTAAEKPDGEALTGVTFLIAKDDPDAVDGRREIARSAAVRPTFSLPAGTYYVTARTPAAEVRQRIGIGAGDTVKRTISLGLAKVIVTADPLGGKRDAANAAALKRPLFVRVVSLEGTPHEVARTTALAPEFSLGAGRYRIEAGLGTGNVRASQDIDLEGGSTRRVPLKLEASTVTLTYTGSSAAHLAWDLRDAQSRSVARGTVPSLTVIAAPGRYTARLDVQDKRTEKTIDLLADGTSRIVEFSQP